MKIFTKETDRVALHSCFLGSTGRIIFDALLVRPSMYLSFSLKTINKYSKHWKGWT